MALTAFKTPALLLLFLSFIFLLTTTASSNWRISSIVNATNWKYEGLWMNCEATSLGLIQCNTLYVPLSSDTFFQVCRALMIISLVLGICGILLALLSLKCPQLGFSDEKTKIKISMMSGIVFALAGLSSMVALSWYAVCIITEFFDPLYAGTRYEMGHALYLGWTGSLLSIIGGILFTCSSRK
ncbi:claudin-15-like [Thamnophis elegans]|uniref:claudin-15-like n=1 Tax=Thamnophis elegans TaxID=35005 RepID=UPI001377BED8|nr:claudin-15-like [Thamnophis elegans]XP_032080737.1 claudin-15-like [Thamnophis elegans]XP_032080738.1 claudin-15-like [Thamnophis elegans]XP_032080739.1 claudin-15-like [Thamnophis elegans]